MKRAAIVGALVADLVKERLLAGGEHGMVRVANFNREEIAAAAVALDGFNFDGRTAPIRIAVGTKDPWPGLDPRFTLRADESATSLRNDVSLSGYVLFEDEGYSDAQGLARVLRIDDRSILRGDHADSNRANLLAAVWSQHSRTGSVPAVVDRLCETVFEVVSADDGVSLRAWVGFLISTIEALGDAATAIDERRAVAALGRSLPQLGLFSDEALPASPSAELRARLDLNRLCAGRRDPRGRIVDADDVASVLQAHVFVDPAGEPLDRAEQERVRSRIHSFLYPLGETTLDVDLDLWLQLFPEETIPHGLGTRIRAHLAMHAEASVCTEYENLDVAEGLDAGDVHSAQRFLDLGAAVVPFLTRELIRAVERVAEPRGASISDPIRFLLRELYGALADAEEGRIDLEFRRVARAHSDDQRSLELFVFLYGPTLTRITRDPTSNQRAALSIAPTLVDLAHARSIQRDREDDDVDPRGGWDPLVLELRRASVREPLRRVEWRPMEHLGLVALRALFHQSESLAWGTRSADFLDWCRPLLAQPIGPLDGARPTVAVGDLDASAASIFARWRELRTELFGRIASSGLVAEELESYVSTWERDVLEPAIRSFVPTGTPSPSLVAFLEHDTCRVGDGSIVLLGTHPLRLRWLSQHLDRTARLVERLLDEGLDLNPVNDSFYFDSVDLLSAHEQPSLLVADEKLFVSVREGDTHEHFATVKTPEASDDRWLGDLDDASIDVLANVVGDYVASHPYKADGISILILVREGGARLLRRFADRALRGNRAPLRTVLHVFAPVTEFAAIERAIGDFDSEEDRGHRAFPKLEVVLNAWAATAPLPSLVEFRENVDLAFVPNLFGAHTRAQESTRPSETGAARGDFDPWIDPPTYLDTSSTESPGEINVSRVLLPVRADPPLSAWSTLCVRAFRHQPVGGDVDYVTLQVRFDRSRELFEDLHRVAHWVVTLDAFVGRDQIEALPRSPDVITVKPRVGKAQAYTLVVSSSSGRSFILERLASRLRQDLPPDVARRAEDLAVEVYEGARFLSPGIVLRALGLGWTTQELVGLCVARRLVDERIRIEPFEGFVAWLSLDDHSAWFGGSNRSRADLVRLSFLRAADGRMRLGMTVVEAKFREQASVQIADTQVTTTLELLDHALRRGEAHPKPVDGDAWTREILQAIEQLSRGGEESRRAFVAWGPDGRVASRMAPAVREDWLEGRYDFDEPLGVVCTIELASTPTPISRTAKGYAWYRVGREEFGRVVDGMAGLRARPAESASTPPEGASQGGRPAMPEVVSSTADAAAPEHTLEPEARTLTPTPVSPESSALTARRGLPDRELEAKYQLVLDVFAEFEVGVARPESDPAREGPGFYLFRVQPNTGVRIEQVRRLSEEIKLKLGLPDDANPRSYVDRGSVVFELPKPDHERYFVDAQSVWGRSTFDDSRLYSPIGEDIQGDVVGIDFSSPDSPHLLIAGQTGSGKSVALETILLGLVEHHSSARLRLALVDPKTTELTRFENDPHLLRPIGYDAEEARSLLEEAVNEMQRRRDSFRSLGARSLPEYNRAARERGVDLLPWWLVVLDEYADLTTDRDDRRAIETLLQRLSQKARASGIHVIVATQRPSADVISTVVRANLPAQLALRVRSATESHIVMAEAGAETLAGKGDAFFRTARGTVRVQCAVVQ